MIQYIADGKTNETVSVEDNKLLTKSVTQDESKQATEAGDGYNINTGTINVTNALKNALLYFKNTGDVDLIIDVAFYIIGVSDGTGDAFLEAVRNPTTGSIITNAVPVSINENRNFGNNNSLDGDAFKGVVGDDFTDGSNILGSIFVVPTTIPVEAGAIILKKGSSIGFNYTAPVGNTDNNIQIAISIYEKQ